MPKILVTGAKGLYQKGGTTGATGTAGTLSGHRSMVETITAAKTLDAEDSGKVFLVGTDALTITLPATKSGLDYTFVNSGADGGVLITISPNSSDALHGTITLAASVVELSGTDDKDLLNTKTTANTGDMVRIVGDGNAGWYVVGSTGIWASET
jgi:hypothetical protein